MKLNERDIERIIASVIENVESVMNHEGQRVKTEPIKMKQITRQQTEVKRPSFTKQPCFTTLSSESGSGVFDHVAEAIEAAHQAQLQWQTSFNLKERERIIAAIRQAVLEKVDYFAEATFKETGIGNVRDKIAKLTLTVEKTPGTELLQTETFSGDDGITLVEQTPYGVIGAITPVTNPVDTIVNNGIGMIAAGNAVVFNVHPSAKNVSKEIIQLLNKTIVAAGGPENLLTMIKEPTIETMQQIASHEQTKLLVGTGGLGMVRSLLRSGKKAIGAGAGNPPVIVDQTANVEQAANDIIEGASFDNNLLCIAEKEVFVLDEVADDLIFELLSQGAYMLSRDHLKRVMDLTLVENTEGAPGGCTYQKRDYLISKEWIGKDASLILKQIGVTNEETKLLLCEVDEQHPFVQLEQMMPILPIVRVQTIDEAIDKAVEAEHGNRHTAIIHSNDIETVTRFARAIGTTIFVNNGSSLSGVGYNGEGFTTMTIAGPTGEGVTSARTFTRQRRTVIARGSLSIKGR